MSALRIVSVLLFLGAIALGIAALVGVDAPLVLEAASTLLLAGLVTFVIDRRREGQH